MLPHSLEEEVDLRDYWHIIQKRRWTIIAFFIILVTTVTIGTFKMEPVYKATTQILIERENPKILSFEEVYAIDSGKTDYYQTQYKLLKSRTLAKIVFAKLALSSSPDFENAKDPIGVFLKRIDIEPVRNSRLVNLSFHGSEPEKTALAANTLADSYIEQNLEVKLSASKYAVNWLSERLDTLKDKVKKADLALQKYMEENNIVSLPTVEGTLKKDLIETLKEKQVVLETQLAELSKRYKDKHPKTIRMKAELHSVKEKLDYHTTETLGLNRKAIQYGTLKREAESNREMYNILLKRAKETSLSEGLQTGNIRVVDAAEVPIKPFRPRKKRNILLASIIGLIGGIGLAFFFEYLDNTIKTPDDVEHYVKLPFLGFIPCTRKRIADAKTIDLISHEEPRSTISEAYRSVRTAIMFSSSEHPAKSILITSAGPQEGKTTNVINLAITMAQAGDKVLLVDTDMRRPRIHKTFAHDNSKGLTNYLVGNAKLKSVIADTSVPNLAILPCGPIPPNPSELLVSHRMKELMEQVNEQFDRILFDSPPIAAVTDAVILANMADGVVQIIHNGKTNCNVVLAGKEKLLGAKAKILGIILNNVDTSRENYYHYYYHHYYYGDDGEKKTRRKRA